MILLTAAAEPALSQTFDFETGLAGWTATGTAFDSQPVAAAQLKTHTYLTVKLGGNYWSNVTYPLGQLNARTTGIVADPLGDNHDMQVCQICGREPVTKRIREARAD